MNLPTEMCGRDIVKSIDDGVLTCNEEESLLASAHREALGERAVQYIVSCPRETCSMWMRLSRDADEKLGVDQTREELFGSIVCEDDQSEPLELPQQIDENSCFQTAISYAMGEIGQPISVEEVCALGERQSGEYKVGGSGIESRTFLQLLEMGVKITEITSSDSFDYAKYANNDELSYDDFRDEILKYARAQQCEDEYVHWLGNEMDESAFAAMKQRMLISRSDLDEYAEQFSEVRTKITPEFLQDLLNQKGAVLCYRETGLNTDDGYGVTHAIVLKALEKLPNGYKVTFFEPSYKSPSKVITRRKIIDINDFFYFNHGVTHLQ